MNEDYERSRDHCWQRKLTLERDELFKSAKIIDQKALLKY